MKKINYSSFSDIIAFLLGVLFAVIIFIYMEIAETKYNKNVIKEEIIQEDVIFCTKTNL